VKLTKKTTCVTYFFNHTDRSVFRDPLPATIHKKNPAFPSRKILIEYDRARALPSLASCESRARFRFALAQQKTREYLDDQNARGVLDRVVLFAGHLLCARLRRSNLIVDSIS